jgi:hypothetical protein
LVVNDEYNSAYVIYSIAMETNFFSLHETQAALMAGSQCYAFSLLDRSMRCPNRVSERSPWWCDLHLAMRPNCPSRISHYHAPEACGPRGESQNFASFRCSTTPGADSIERMNLPELDRFAADLGRRERRVSKCESRRREFDDHCIFYTLRGADHAYPIAEMQRELPVCEDLRRRVRERREEEFDRELRAQERRLAAERAEMEARYAAERRALEVSRAADVFGPWAEQIETRHLQERRAQPLFREPSPEPTDEEIAELPGMEPDWWLDEEVRRVREGMIRDILAASLQPPFAGHVRLFKAYLLAAYLTLMKNGFPPSPVTSNNMIRVVRGMRDADSLRQLWDWTQDVDEELMAEAEGYVEDGVM